MEQKQVILQFRFPTFGDSMLQKMNLLRLQRRFCDVTVHVNELEVPGHKVVLAAGSSFLRDQFVLQQESGQVQISMSQESEVGRRLLLSCYTGQLEFPELELVHYLTVASFLQMGHIVEQCTQALDKFIKPPRPPPQHPLLEAEEDHNTGLDGRRMGQEDESRQMRRKRKEEEECFSSRPSCRQQECSSQTCGIYRDEKVERVDDDDCDDDCDDDVIIQPETPPPPPPPPPPTQSSRCVRRDAAPAADSVGGITIVKVESVNDDDTSEHSMFPSSCSSSDRSPLLHSPAEQQQPQHALINSTVDSVTVTTRIGADMAATAMASMSAFAPLSPASPPPPLPPPPPSSSSSSGGKQHTTQGGSGGAPHGSSGHHPRGYDKPLQWYHQCPKCARVFRQLENYANHLKMHKLFMCLLCGKTFTQKGNLHRHMRVHAGIKPFQCKICGKTFTQKCSLLDHLNLHSGDKPHRCNYCDMVFAHKPVLRKHLKQIHGKTSFDNANERGGGGGLEFDFGQVKTCGLTAPVRAPPISHQVQDLCVAPDSQHQALHSGLMPPISHQVQDLCVAPDSQHQALHSGLMDS